MIMRMTHTLIFKGIALLMVCVFASSMLVPQEALAAAARSYNGGKLAKFNVGQFALATGIALVSVGVSSALSSGMQQAGIAPMPPNTPRPTTPILTTMGNAFVNNFNSWNKLALNYTTFVATSQIGRAVGAMGNYYGWSPMVTYAVSGFASGAVGGFLNPTPILGEMVTNPLNNMSAFDFTTRMRGAVVGSITGAASSIVVAGIGGSNMKKGKPPGPAAQIAGMVVGCVVGGYMRTVVDPSTYTSGRQGEVVITRNPDHVPGPERITVGELYAQREAAGLPTNDIPVESWDEARWNQPYNFARITNTHPTAATDTSRPFEDTVPVPPEEVHRMMQEYDAGRLQLPQIGPNRHAVLQVNTPQSATAIGERIFQAAIVDTAAMYPELIARSLSIVATSSLSKKNQWLSPLISSVVEGFSRPILRNFAEFTGWKPDLYWGEMHNSRSIAWSYSLRNAALANNLDTVNTDLYAARARGASAGELQGIVRSGVGDDSIIIPSYGNREDERRAVEAQIRASEPTIGREEVQRRVDLLNEGCRQAEAAGARYNAEEQPLRWALRTGRDSLERRMGANNTLDGAIHVAGTSRWSLFWRNTFRDVGYGVFEGFVTGGIASLAAKVSNKNPAAGALLAYSAAMATGAIRGVIWHATWEPNRINDMEWMPQFTIYRPRPYSGDLWWQRAADAYTYPREQRRFEEFAAVSNLSPVVRPRTIYTRMLDGSMPSRQVDEVAYELRFSNEKPSLGGAVMASLAQANHEFMTQAFSFGAPIGKPENVNTLMMVDYLNHMHGYAMAATQPGWLTSGILSSMSSAGASTVSTNILTSLGAYRPTARLINMQHQRLVRTMAPPDGGFIGNYNPNPFTIQNLDYQAWLANRHMTFYLPFPNDTFRSRNRSGKTFTRDR